LYDFQERMALGREQRKRAIERQGGSSVQVFASSQDRWAGWTKEDWEANDMDAAIDDAEACEYGLDDYERGPGVDAPGPGGQRTEEETLPLSRIKEKHCAQFAGG
jgi:hypothetical protein